MKKLLLLACLAIATSVLYGQIQNGSFEEWEPSGEFEKPVGWDTNQWPGYMRMEKDSQEVVSGKYAVKLIPSSITGWTQCDSWVEQEINLGAPLGHGKSLYLYVKALPDNEFDEVFVRVRGFLYKYFSFQGDIDWTNFVPIEEYTLIELPMPYPQSNKIVLTIAGSAGDGPADGCWGQSNVWVDSVFIAEKNLTTLTEPTIPNISIGPNPFTGTFEIFGEIDQIKGYHIYDLTGRIIQAGVIATGEIQVAQEGILFLVLEMKDGSLLRFKMISASP